MNHRHFYLCITLLIFCSLFTIVSCVSIPIKKSETYKSSTMEFNPPSEPFIEITSESADKIWLSKITGNTLSILSECGNASDPSLESLEQESLSGVNNKKIVKSESIDFNSREARSTTISGTVDGVEVKLNIIVYKKNNCNYTLSYGGVFKNFDSEAFHFDKFVKTFKADN